MTLRALIAEDEPLPRRRLRRMLETQDVRVVAACESRAEAVGWLSAHPEGADALFLDVELGDGSGFDVIDALPAGGAPPVVFVTAYDQFAVRAFEVRAVDYLLKPFEAHHVRRALERVRDRIAHPRSATELEALRDLVAELRAQADSLRNGAGDRLARIPVRTRGETVLVPVESIDWIGSADNYVELHCGDAVHLVRRPMASLEERLDPARFVRIHRRTIVHVERIRACRTDASGDLEVVLRDGRALKVGRSFRERLSSWLHSGD
jgi:two-component system LytT family response regulator